MEIELPVSFDGTMVPTYNEIQCGQTIMFFTAPDGMVDRMNKLYDEGKKNKTFPVVNDQEQQLHEEFSLYLDDDEDTVENHNFLPDDVHKWAKDRIHQYLQLKNVKYYGIKTHASWINEYRPGEYNPQHIHLGRYGMFNDPYHTRRHREGLVGMMALKMPEMVNVPNKEEKNEDLAKLNKTGFLEFNTGNNYSMQFAHNIIPILLRTGDFVVFPYDMYHVLYPHFNKTEVRRTFPVNIDVFDAEV